MSISYAVGYIRFSSAIQELGTSTRRQRKMIDDWCKAHPDVTLLNVYTDLGKSAWQVGKQSDRKGFMQLKADRASQTLPEPIYLLVEDASRLSRLEFTEATAEMKRLIEMGFVIVFLASGKVYDLTNFRQLGDHISFLVDAETHNKASEQKSHHSRRNWKQKREDAILTGKLISKSCARWCTPVATGTGEPSLSGRKSTFVFNEHMQTVQRIFMMRLAGESMNSITFTLNAEHVPTLTGKDNAWNQTTVHGILNNRAVIGEYVPSRNAVVEDAETIPDYYPLIPGITPAMFQTVQQMREGKGRTSGSDNPTNINLFKGVLKCLCGGAIISSSVTPERYGYYSCSMYRMKRCKCMDNVNHGKGKGKRSAGAAISRQLVDDRLVSGLLHNLPVLFSGSNTDQQKLTQLEAERALIMQELENLEDNMSRMKASQRMIDRYQEKEEELHQKDLQIDQQRGRLLTVTKVDTVDSLDVLTREGRTEINLIVKKYIREIRLDVQRKCCDIILMNGNQIHGFSFEAEADNARLLDLAINGDREHDAEFEEITGQKIPSVFPLP